MNAEENESELTSSIGAVSPWMTRVMDSAAFSHSKSVSDDTIHWILSSSVGLSFRFRDSRTSLDAMVSKSRGSLLSQRWASFLLRLACSGVTERDGPGLVGADRRSKAEGTG